jgi:hypothetical protein
LAYPVPVDRQSLEQRRDQRREATPTVPSTAGPRHAQLSELSATLNAAPPVQRLAAITPPNRTGLPDQLKHGVETMSGMSLDGVKVHYNSAKPATLNAHAYAQGSDIHLGPGQERHLPHEAWHVVQQAQGRVRPTRQMKSGIAVNDDAGLEGEANVMGTRAMSVGASPAQRLLAAPHAMRGSVVQGKFAVEINVEEYIFNDPVVDISLPQPPHVELRINTVNIADRPKGLFSGGEKSHTTAWAVYTDQLRNAILGRPVAEAAGAVTDLYTDSRNLPGVARAGNLTGVAKIRYDAAEQEIEKLAAIKIGTIEEGRQVDYLQRLAKAFLAYRNVIPLSQADIGRATGHGEPEVLKTLRPLNDVRAGWEPDGTEGDMKLKEGVAPASREAMWSLLDAGVLGSLYSLQATPATMPGVADHVDGGAADGGAAQRIADVITQHLWTLEATYETVFRAVEMDGEQSIRDYLRRLGYRGLFQDLVYTKITRHYENAVEKVATENPARLMTAGAANQGTFSVQVDTDDEGNVIELHVGNRAPTSMGSAQGSHSTAWLVYVDSVRNVVIKQPAKIAIKNMLGLCATLASLPGMSRVKTLTEVQQYWFKLAETALQQAEAAAKSLSNDILTIQVLQRLIRAYLGFRNVVPLSQVKGGLADGNAEGHNRAIMRYCESDFANWTGKGAPPEKSKNVYLTALWELYDYTAMWKAAKHMFEAEDAPGIHKKDQDLDIIADSIKQHLIAVEQAYPKTFALLGAADDSSIIYVMNRMTIMDEYYAAIMKRVRA